MLESDNKKDIYSSKSSKFLEKPFKHSEGRTKIGKINSF